MKNTKRIFLSLFFIILFFTCFLTKVSAAEPNKLWNKNFGGSNDDYFTSIIQTSDGGYTAVGYSHSNDGDESGLYKGAQDAVIVKYDSNGNKLWNKNFGGSNDDYFTLVIQTSDGGYAAVGYSLSIDGDESGLNKGGSDGIIVKYDSKGNKVWNKNFGGSSQDCFYSVIQTSDGGYTAVGHSLSIDGDESGLNKDEKDAVIVKYDFNGNKLWNKNFGGSGDDYFTSVIQTSDEGFTAVGYSNSNNEDELGLSKGTSNYDAVIVKYDSNGNKLWNKNFGGSSDDRFTSIIQTSDGGYTAVGYSASTDGDENNLNKGRYGISDGIIVNYDANGNKLWNKNFGGSSDDRFTSIIQTLDDGYAVVGSSQSSDGDESGLYKGVTDAVVVKYDSNGNKLWNKNFGGSNIDNFSSIIQTSDGSYAIAGYSYSTDNDETGLNIGGEDAVIVKYDCDNILFNKPPVITPSTLDWTNNNVPINISANSSLPNSFNKLWNKNFGGSNQDYFNSIAKTSDGGFVTVGSSSSTDNDETGLNRVNESYDAIIAKYDSKGNKVWNKNFGGSNDDRFNSVTQTSDGGYIAVGKSYSYDGDETGLNKCNANSYDAIIVKYDANGNKLWNKNFGGSGADIFNSVIQVSDGGYIAVGNSISINGDEDGLNKGNNDAIIVKYDSSGNKVWNKNFGGSNHDYFQLVTQTSDGKFVAVGISASTDGDESLLNKGNQDAIIVEYDTNGNKLWNKNFGGSSDDVFNSIMQTSDGGFAAVGYSSSNNGDEAELNKGNNDTNNDAIIVKYDANGNKLWNKNFGGSNHDYFQSIIQTSDGGYTTVGYSASINGDEDGLNKYQEDAIIVKYDANGNKIWNKNFGGSNNDRFNSVTQTLNGEYITVGNSNSTSGDESGLNKGNNGLDDAIIVKYGSNLTNQYQIDGGTWTNYSGIITISTEGIHTINARTNDDSGNLSSVSTTQVKIDKTAPTAPTINPSAANSTSDITFTLSKISDVLSGAAKSQYQIDNGIWTDYSDIVTITPVGTHIINAKTFDKAGNVSITASTTVKIINIPTPKITPSTTEWTNSNVSVNISNIAAPNGEGNKLWNKNFGGYSYDYFYSVTQISDGGYVAVGYSQSSDKDESGLNKGGWDAIIVKYDSNGNKLWNKNFGGSNSDYFYSVTQTSDGGFIAVGCSASNDKDEAELNKGGWDAIIVKYDSNGNKVWNKNFGGSNWDYFNSVTQTSDKGFIAVGYSNSYDGDEYGLNKWGNGDNDAIIVKYDSNGNKLWNKSFGGSSEDKYLSVTQTSDGGFIAVGNSTSTDGDESRLNKGNMDAIIVKYDSNGNKLWNKNFGGYSDDYFSSITQSSDGKCIVAGYSASTDGDEVGLNKGSTDAIIVKYDSNGNKLWNKNFGGSTNDSFNLVTQTSDGGCVAVGCSASNDIDESELNKRSYDAIIVKYDSSGNKLWNKNFGGYSEDKYLSVTQTSDGGYIAVGNSTSIDEDEAGLNKGDGYDDAIIVKYDSAAFTQYQIDDEAWTTYVDTLTIQNEGIHTINARTNDGSGNLSSISTTQVKIDKTAPNAPTINPSATSSISNITFTLNGGSDALSGTAKSQYQIDSGTWNDYLSTVTITSIGTHIINAKVIDNAGNISSISSATVIINNPSAPTITPSTTEWTNSNVSVNISSIITSNGEGNKLWNKNFGGSNADYFNSVIQTSDGGYAAVGYSDSNNGDEIGLNKNQNDAIIVKYDTNGNKFWNKNFGGYQDDVFTSILQTSDGGFIAVGYSYSTDGDESGLNKGQSDGIIVKYSSNGNKLWNKNFGGYQDDKFNSIMQTSDGGFIVVGYSGSSDEDEIGLAKGAADAIIVKYDSNGNKLWNKNFGGSEYDSFQSIVQTSDGGYVAVGYSTSNNEEESGLNKGGNDAIIVKYDSNGNKLWNKNFGGTNVGGYSGSSDDRFYSVTPTSDGGYVAAGYSQSTDGDESGLNKGNYDAVIAKYDSNGNKIWNKNFGGTSYDYFESVIRTSDGGFVAVGKSYSNDGDEIRLNKGDYDAIIVKYDSNGNKLWNKNFGGSNGDVFNAVIQTSDGGYVTVGNSTSTDGDESGLNKGSSSFDAIIAKYNGSACTQYQIDKGTWTNYTGVLTISTEGIHTINARTNDGSGNLSPISTAVVKIDKTNPGAAVITPSTVNWTNNDVTISINDGTDALSGAAKSQYQLDSGTWTDYTSVITITNEGIHTINAKTFDKAGNVSNISSSIVKIDKTSAAAVVNPSSYDGSRININYNTMPTNAASVIHLNNIIDNLSGVSNVKVWFTKSSDTSNAVGSNCLDFDITSGTTDKDLSIQLPEDSIYGDNIHFQITDNAGNKSYFYGNIQLEILVPEVPAVSGIVNDKLYLKGENININWTYKDDNTPVLPQGKVDFIFTNMESNSVTTKTLEGTAASYQIPVDNVPDGITKVKVRVYNSGNKYSDSSESTIRINRFNPNGKILTKTIELADSIQFASVYTDYVMPKNTSIKCILYYWNENASCFDENHKVILNIANKNALAQLPYSTNKFKIKYILNSTDIINVAGTDYAKVSPTITSCRLYGK